MNIQTEITKQRFREHGLLGKETFTINEINRILMEVDYLIENKNNTIKEIKETPEQFFKSVMNRITEIRTDDKYPDSKFYMIGDKVYIEQNTKTNDFYLRYNDFWSYFYDRGLIWDSVCKLTKKLLIEYLGYDVNKTDIKYMSKISLFEEHLKYNTK